MGAQLEASKGDGFARVALPLGGSPLTPKFRKLSLDDGDLDDGDLDDGSEVSDATLSMTTQKARELDDKGEEKVTSRKRRRMGKKQKGERKEEDAAAEEVVDEANGKLAGGGKKTKPSKRKNKRRKQINQEKQQKKKQKKLARITGAPEVAVDSLKIKPLTVNGALDSKPAVDWRHCCSTKGFGTAR